MESSLINPETFYLNRHNIPGSHPVVVALFFLDVSPEELLQGLKPPSRETLAAIVMSGFFDIISRMTLNTSSFTDNPGNLKQMFWHFNRCQSYSEYR
jgi:hypothetical protein